MERRNRRVTVVSVDPWLDKPHGNSVLGIFRSLVDHGCAVSVLIPSGGLVEKRGHSFSVRTVKSKRTTFFGYFAFLFRAIMYAVSSKPDVLIFDTSLIPCFLCLKIISRIKGVMMILSRPLKQPGFKSWLKHFQFRLFLNLGSPFVDAFTAISPFEVFEFSKLGHIRLEKFKIIPSPLGEGFRNINVPEDLNELRRSLGLNKLVKKRVLLYHGVLDDRRKLMSFLETFQKACVEDDVILLLVGSGRSAHLVEEFIERNRPKNILFLGSMPYTKMPEIVASCDIGLVLLPNNLNWRNQTPTKLLEFLALNKPVIASDLAGIRWVAQKSPLVVYVKPLGNMTVGEFQGALREVGVKKTAAQTRFLNRSYSSQPFFDRFSSQFIAADLNRIIISVKG